MPPGEALLLDRNQAVVLFLTGGEAAEYGGLAADRARPFRTDGWRKAAHLDGDLAFSGGRLLGPGGGPAAGVDWGK